VTVPKRVDNNATMEVTESQLLELREEQVKKRPIPPPASTDRNDASVWAYRTVGAEEFAPIPRTSRGPRARTWLVVLLVVVLLGAGAYVAYTRYFASQPDKPAASPPAPATAPPTTGPPATAPRPPATKPTTKPTQKKR
jgi:hypothetical protein